MRKLIFTNFQSPGDIVMLTAAVRDLHQYYPGQFITDVRTTSAYLWEHNPNITPLNDNERDIENINCEYPLVHKCNTLPYHFLHGFIDFLNQKLGLHIKPTAFKGDLYLSDEERPFPSDIKELAATNLKYWIIVSGGKQDFTVKWWDPVRYQQVVDHFKGKIQFVQVGEKEHHHPGLKGVIDLRGRTEGRKIIQLMYHADGVLTPVNLLMHLAAAVDVKEGMPKNRPCVVVAGGREPPHWEAYPHHQFIHTIGALPCCDNGGCWKSRVVPLNDGNRKDLPQHLCVDVAGDLPRCMDMITAEEVIRRIELYYTGGSLLYRSEKMPEPEISNKK